MMRQKCTTPNTRAVPTSVLSYIQQDMNTLLNYEYELNFNS